MEKKPEKRPPSELSEFGPTESFPEGAGPMPEGPTMPMEEGMESRDGYVPGAPSDMPGFEGEGMGPREGALPPAPLAASYVSLTGGIIRALGANGTPEARHVLEELLLGKIPIGNERLAVGAVLRALVDYPNTENELLLYRVLTSPEEFRKNEAKLREEVEQAIAAAPRPAPPAPPARPAAPPSPMASEGVPGMEDGMTGRPPVVDEAAQAAAAVEAALRNMVSAEISEHRRCARDEFGVDGIASRTGEVLDRATVPATRPAPPTTRNGRQSPERPGPDRLLPLRQHAARDAQPV